MFMDNDDFESKGNAPDELLARTNSSTSSLGSAGNLSTAEARKNALNQRRQRDLRKRATRGPFMGASKPIATSRPGARIFSAPKAAIDPLEGEDVLPASPILKTGYANNYIGGFNPNASTKAIPSPYDRSLARTNSVESKTMESNANVTNVPIDSSSSPDQNNAEARAPQGNARPYGAARRNSYQDGHNRHPSEQQEHNSGRQQQHHQANSNSGPNNGANAEPARYQDPSFPGADFNSNDRGAPPRRRSNDGQVPSPYGNPNPYNNSNKPYDRRDGSYDQGNHSQGRGGGPSGREADGFYNGQSGNYPPQEGGSYGNANRRGQGPNHNHDQGGEYSHDQRQSNSSYGNDRRGSNQAPPRHDSNGPNGRSDHNQGRPQYQNEGSPQQEQHRQQQRHPEQQQRPRSREDRNNNDPQQERQEPRSSRAPAPAPARREEQEEQVDDEIPDVQERLEALPTEGKRPDFAPRDKKKGRSKAAPRHIPVDDESDEESKALDMSRVTAPAKQPVRHDHDGIEEAELDEEVAQSPSQHLDLTDMRRFLMEPVPKAAGVVQCYIERNKNGAKKMFPEYNLFMKEGDRFLLSSKKRAKNRTSNYIVSMQQHDLNRDSPSFLGKLRSNFLGTEFTIYDKGVNPKNSDPDALQSAPGLVRQELAVVQYASNVLGSRGPRKMKVAVPHVSDEGVRQAWRPSRQSEQMLTRFKDRDLTGLIKLTNKPPRWNESVGAYVLNFNGRVTMASVKNFQLVTQDDPDDVALQFGRVGKDLFTMDFQFPLSPFQAFTICLSSFDSKLACE